MLYIVDTDVIVQAKRLYYGFERVPEFWTWLVQQGEVGNIKIPHAIFSEFKDTNNKEGEKDVLAQWADQKEVKDALILDEEEDIDLIRRVTYGGYTPNPTDAQLITIGRDPILIATALKDVENRCVVTNETPASKKIEHNRKIPNVCEGFDINCINGIQLFHRLDFRTDWNK